MKILFIGGTGIISTGCTEVALEQGHEVWHLRRGISGENPRGVHWLQGDIRNLATEDLKGQTFDAVVNFMAFIPEHIDNDWRLFRDKTAHYVFISSASCYSKPVNDWPILETTPLHNPRWKYSMDKISCETRVLELFRQNHFPATIIRPSHTYGYGPFPMDGGYTLIDRMRQGKKVIVHGDGTSLWALTHARDFGQGLMGLLGKSQALGEAYHITTDRLLTWNRIVEIIAAHLEVEPRLVHLPSDWIALASPSWGDSLLGDKSHSVIFDNAKIKSLVPGFNAKTRFEEGVADILRWYEADSTRQVKDIEFDQACDKLVEMEAFMRTKISS